jgi:NAD(P)H dehydrogenase (quinone)
MKIAIIYHSETGNTREMARLVREGCLRIPGVEPRCMSVEDVDVDYVIESAAVVFGSPVYAATPSWKLMNYFHSVPKGLSGKLGGVFVSQGHPAGGGDSFAEMAIIACMLCFGMMVYSGDETGRPLLHLGAVSVGAPKEGIYRDRCLKLGENIARQAMKLFRAQ